MSIYAPEQAPKAPSPNMLPLQIMEGRDSLYDLADHLDMAGQGDRVALLSMCYDPADAAARRVVTAMTGAAARGASIHFGLDAYEFLVHPNFRQPGPLLLPEPFREKAYADPVFAQRRDALEELSRAENVTFHLINEPGRPFTNPFGGRSHIKLGVVNDRSYIVGANLDGTDRRDMTVVCDDARTANWLHEVGARIVKAGNVVAALGDEDLAFPIDDATKLLLDVGKPNQSIILEEVHQTIATADEWLVSASQYFPDGNVAKWLGDASRRRRNNDAVDVHIARNDPASLSLLTRTKEYMAAFRQSRCLADAMLHQARPGEFMHTHGIVSEQRAMGGSFNNDERGVKFGTAELVVLRDDPLFARSMGEFILSQLGVSADRL